MVSFSQEQILFSLALQKNTGIYMPGLPCVLSSCLMKECKCIYLYKKIPLKSSGFYAIFIPNPLRKGSCFVLRKEFFVWQGIILIESGKKSFDL